MDIRKPKDPNDLSDFERTHIPSIEIPYQPKKGEIFELIVKIGEIMHVMDEDHFIERVGLYNDNLLLDKIDLGPEVLPTCIFNISFLDNICLRVVASCNLHGKWEKVIRVDLV